MTCLELDALLTDYLDGVLNADEKALAEAHLAGCAGCAGLAQDASSAVAFMDRAAVVEPPAELMSNILAELRVGPSRAVVQPSWIERVFGLHAGAILQPRFAMGLAMTILSFAMIGKLAGSANPVRIWNVTENRVIRTWDRARKGYENLAVMNDLEDQWNRLSEGPDAPGR